MDRDSEPTLYEILGIDYSSTEEEIREAFHTLARVFHPDSNYYADLVNSPPTQQQIESFKKISNAYTVLKDPVKRAAYDDRIRKKIMLYGNSPNDEEAQIANKLAELGLGDDVARIAGVNVNRVKENRKRTSSRNSVHSRQSSVADSASKAAESWSVPKSSQKPSGPQSKASSASSSSFAQHEQKKFRSW